MAKTKTVSAAKKLSYAQKVRKVNSLRVRGDVNVVARCTNYHPGHVSNVFSGKYRNQEIVDAAYEMLRSRKG